LLLGTLPDEESNVKAPPPGAWSHCHRITLACVADGCLVSIWIGDVLLPPPFSLGRGEIASWTKIAFPPQGGAWIEGLSTIHMDDTIMISIENWVSLMIIVRLADRFILRRRNA
jgi:hypothetical protein